MRFEKGCPSGPDQSLFRQHCMFGEGNGSKIEYYVIDGRSD